MPDAPAEPTDETENSKGDPLKFGILLIAIGAIGVIVVVAYATLRGPLWLLVVALAAIPNVYTGIKSIRSARKR